MEERIGELIWRGLVEKMRGLLTDRSIILFSLVCFILALGVTAWGS